MNRVTISEFTKKVFCTEALLRHGYNEFVPKPWELMAHSPFSYSIDAITSVIAYFVNKSASTQFNQWAQIHSTSHAYCSHKYHFKITAMLLVEY